MLTANRRKHRFAKRGYVNHIPAPTRAGCIITMTESQTPRGSSEGPWTLAFARGDYLRPFGAILNSIAFRSRISEEEYEVNGDAEVSFASYSPPRQ